LLRGRTIRPRHAILLPGFGTIDRALLPLRSYLRSIGHHGHGWEIGRHAKHVEASVERFLRVVEQRVASAEESIVLVGWSLGAIVAPSHQRRAEPSVAQKMDERRRVPSPEPEFL
jgi:hypothetical protein